jgi:hypothetical protein
MRKKDREPYTTLNMNMKLGIDIREANLGGMDD